MPLKIILDSNFLFVPIQFQVDIIKELKRVTNRNIEAILLSPVYDEVQTLSTKRGMKRRVETALKYAENLKLVNCEINPSETVDDLILRIAVEWNCPVATNDRTLRKKLRDINITVIFLRQKSHLEIDGQV